MNRNIVLINNHLKILKFRYIGSFNSLINSNKLTHNKWLLYVENVYIPSNKILNLINNQNKYFNYILNF